MKEMLMMRVRIKERGNFGVNEQEIELRRRHAGVRDRVRGVLFDRERVQKMDNG